MISARPAKIACGIKYKVPGAKCRAMSEVGSNTFLFFMYVTNAVTAKNRTNPINLACERRGFKAGVAATVDMRLFLQLVRRIPYHSASGGNQVAKSESRRKVGGLSEYL